MDIPKFDAASLRQLAEGKTKVILEISPDLVLVKSKDQITAFNAVRKHELSGIRTHFIKQHSESEFVARRCEMIPIEWITRRIATGSFLKRNPGVKEGYRFCPPKVEITYKDDAQGDPIWSEEMLIEAGIEKAGIHIGRQEVELMTHVTRTVFEVLERAWASLGCTLVDMKIEFGVIPSTGEIVLADVIDSDSWRLWPAGDKRLQLDKQFYRDLPEVTQDSLAQLKANFEKACEMLKKFIVPPKGRIVCLMGSPSDKEHCLKIKTEAEKLGVPCLLRIVSAHKITRETLDMVAFYEGDGIPTVFVCVAGRSNGLGPVLAGNTVCPVINAPPIGADWGAQDVWSSLRLPSGLGCSTVIVPETAALHAATILAQYDHMLWSRLRVQQLNNYITLTKADKELCNLTASKDGALVINGVH